MNPPRPYRSMLRGPSIADHNLASFGEAVCNRPPGPNMTAIYNGPNFLMSVATDHADAVARALNDAFAAGMAYEAARSPLRAMRDDVAGGEG